MNQVHGDAVVVIDDFVNEPTADALITQNPHIALAVMVADCIPLLLVSDSVIAAVHVGRRGLVNGIAVKTVNKMRELGASHIRAELGPSICGKCYEVPQDLADEVALLHPVAMSMTIFSSPALDLPRALVAALEAVGVSSQVSAVCTLENPNYFSYRRHNITGRTAGVIWL
jgi:YfiH family protein